MLDEPMLRSREIGLGIAFLVSRGERSPLGDGSLLQQALDALSLAKKDPIPETPGR